VVKRASWKKWQAMQLAPVMNPAAADVRPRTGLTSRRMTWTLAYENTAERSCIVPIKLSCLISAVFLLSGVAAFAQSTLQVGPSAALPAIPALAVGPGGTPGPGGTLIAPGNNLSGIQNLTAQSLVPAGCGGGGFASAPLSLTQLFPPGTIPDVDTPVIPLDSPIGC
jgi:hypothetical protein